jgi:hypothetical protein
MIFDIPFDMPPLKESFDMKAEIDLNTGGVFV